MRFGQQLIDQFGAVLRQPAHLSQQPIQFRGDSCVTQLRSLIEDSFTETIGYKRSQATLRTNQKHYLKRAGWSKLFSRDRIWLTSTIKSSSIASLLMPPMTKPTRVNFINTFRYDDLVIAPANSSKSRWKTFVVKPGKTGQVTDSNGGKNNYDVEFTAALRRGSLTKHDKIIGTFRFDNPWMGAPYMTALDKYNALLGPNYVNRVPYWGNYAPPGYIVKPIDLIYNNGRISGCIAGNINKSGLVPGVESTLLSKMPYTAFIPGQPCAEIKFISTTEEWTFWASPDPNPGLFN